MELATINAAAPKLPIYEIPPDIYNDVLYCQKVLRVHIKVHQVSGSRIIVYLYIFLCIKCDIVNYRFKANT